MYEQPSAGTGTVMRPGPSRATRRGRLHRFRGPPDRARCVPAVSASPVGMPDVTPRHAATAAYVAAAVNLAAGLVMLLTLRHAIPAGESDLSARIAYVGDHLLVWRLGWLVLEPRGHLFIGVLRGPGRAMARAGAHPLRTRAALCRGRSGSRPRSGDHPRGGVSESSWRDLRDGRVGRRRTHRVFGQRAVRGRRVLLTLAGRRDLPPSLLWLAAAVWTTALWLSIATLVSSNAGQFASAAALMPLFVLWAALTGRWLSGRAS